MEVELLNSLFRALEAAGGMLVVLLVWLALQWLARSRSRTRAGDDPLAPLFHGCAGCNGSGACHNLTSDHDEDCAANDRRAEAHAHEHQ